MPGANEHDPIPARPDAAREDPLARLIDTLADSAGASRNDVLRRVRELLPAAVGEIADSNRRLRESAHRRDALVGSAASELRTAAAVLEAVADGTSEPLDEAARLRLRADDLERAIHPPAAEPRSAVPRGRGSRARLVIADDEPDAREALSLVLSDFEVFTASDGLEAVDLARAEQPDVVLLDVAMPHLDGFQALDRLRGDPVTAEIPVIFVSARSDDAVKVRSLDLGAVDYLQKPFSERELRARVERTLRLVRSQTALRELAQTDALTGLANLRSFRARLDEEVKRARRYRTPLACVMADMDQLKPINDELGHAAGDRAIAAVAAVLRHELRETDFGARYGGDEFVLLLPHTTAEEARVFAERACARLRENVLDFGGRRVTLGASFGVACLAPGARDEEPEALVHAADAALYAAKRSGRGRVALAESPAPDAGAPGGPSAETTAHAG